MAAPQNNGKPVRERRTGRRIRSSATAPYARYAVREVRVREARRHHPAGAPRSSRRGRCGTMGAVTARRSTPSVLALAGMLLPTAALAGCATSDVDRAQLEAQVQRSLEGQVRPRLQVRAVSCPDRLPAEAGAQTHCWITISAGRTVTAVVTVTGTANNRLQFDLKLEQNPA